MKILIITYYKTINPGTVLQAYGVQKGFQKIFPQAAIHFLKTDYKKKSSAKKQYSVNKLQLLLNKFYNLIRKLKFKRITDSLFLETEKCFNYFDYSREEFIAFANGYDIICVGSDTILERVSNTEQIGLMWIDENINSCKIVFAASGSDCKDVLNKTQFYKRIYNNLSKFDYLGVRDNIIRNTLIDEIKITSKLINKLPDPTYLIPINTFKLTKRKINKLKKHNKILMYHIDRRFIYRNELSKRLKEIGYFLITPEYDPSCDLSFKHLDPFEWGALFKYCELIITERFHDTVFALKYGKPVFTIDWDSDKYFNNKSKRSEILDEYGLMKHHIIVKDITDLDTIIEKIDVELPNFNVTNIQKKNKDLADKIHNSLLDIKRITKT